MMPKSTLNAEVRERKKRGITVDNGIHIQLKLTFPSFDQQSLNQSLPKSWCLVVMQLER